MKNTIPYKDAAKELNIDTSLLRLCQSNKAPGCNTNGTVNMNKFVPWYEKHKSEIETKYVTTYEAERTEDKRLGNILKRIAIKEKEKALLDPEDMKKCWASFGLTLSSIIKKKQVELTSKCSGYEKIIGEGFLDIFTTIDKELAKWE